MEATKTKEGKKEPKKPDFAGDGVAIWENIDKNGHKYLSIKIVGHNTISVWENKP